MVSVPTDNQVAAWSPATPTRIRIAHVTALSGLGDHTGYTAVQNGMDSTTVLERIDGCELPMLIDGRSEICAMNEEVARELNISCKHADWKMITADGNWSNSMKVAQSIPLNGHGIIIPMPLFLAQSGFKQIIFGHAWETYAR